jgi:undecaprenyl-diphosphatase
MPLLLLLLIAAVVGGLAALAAERYRRVGVSTPTPTVEIARKVGMQARRHPRLREALALRLDPQRLTGLALTLALAVIFVGGLVLATLVVVVRDTQALSGLDSGVATWGDRHATHVSTQGLRVVTSLGETWMVLLVGAVLAFVEMRRTRSRWAILFLLAVVAGDKLLTSTIKHLVDRVRPDIHAAAATLGPSFPSGHSSTAAAFWAAAALVAARWCSPRARPVLVGLAAGIAVAVAASRVLLDVHWLTDVVAGLALGWAWFGACAIAFGGRLLRFGSATDIAARTAGVFSARSAPD